MSKEINKQLKTLSKLKKANKLVQLYFHEKGPRSYKRGVGALLSTLANTKKGEVTQRKLSSALGLSRKDLKSVVKKAGRKGFVTIEDAGKKKTYIVKLTPEGERVANKRDDAQQNAAASLAEVLSAEELEQLDAICEKLIVAVKDAGVSGKKKGRKFHKKRRKCCPEGHKHHSCHPGHGHGHGHGCGCDEHEHAFDGHHGCEPHGHHKHHKHHGHHHHHGCGC